jgi:glycosyltransferase involved in cell wall biosynthesis
MEGERAPVVCHYAATLELHHSAMSKPLRILHIYKDYFPVLGGIENHIKVLAEAQAAQGHQVTVLVANPQARTITDIINGVHVIQAARWATAASTPISPAMFTWTARLEADVAHLHFPHPPGEVANLLLGRARRTVITYHSDIVRQRTLRMLYGPLLWHVLRHANRLIATSPGYISSSPYLRHLRDKCVIVPLGTDVQRFARVDAEHTAALRRKWLAGSAPSRTLLFVGRLRYYKGLDDLLRALPELPDAHLLVIGDGPMRTAWEQLAQELGVSGRVTFAGQVHDDDLPACYRLGDLFVLPANARAEAFGTVIIEAMSAGLPIVCTEVDSGTSWVNQDGVTGIVVPPRNPHTLAQAIQAILSDPNRRAEMGRAAQQRAQSEFSQATMIARVEQVYRDALNA